MKRRDLTLRNPERKPFSHAIVTLLFTCAVAAASSAGCQPAADRSPPLASYETLGRIDAQPQTRAETGIDAWIVMRSGTSFLVDGRTATGVSIHQVRIQPFSTTLSRDGGSQPITGMEVSSSGGGFVRIASDRTILTFTSDDATFAAFARDMEVLRKGDVTLNCGVFQWIGCLAAVLAAGAACGPFGLECAAAILGLGSCFECFCQMFGGCGGEDGGGGGDGGPCGGGQTPYDCGDGCFACAEQPCPIGPCE